MKFAKTTSFPGAIFSNVPDYIYTITGNRAAMIPRKIDPDNGLPNKRYSDELTEMKEPTITAQRVYPVFLYRKPSMVFTV